MPTSSVYLMVVALVREALAVVELPAPALEAPAFFSKTFQNLRDSSAARGCVSNGTLGRMRMRILTSSGEHLTVWAEAAVEDSALVGWNLNVLDKSWVAPDRQAVVWEARAGDDLLVAVAPPERGDLATSVNGVGPGTAGGVPEVDHAIVATTTSGKEVALPWAPGQSLDGSLVVGLLKLWGVERASVPDVDQVVVATSGELGAVGAPLKTTDLASVADEFRDLVLGDADIVVEDKTRASASGEEVLVPAHDANAGIVAEHGAKLSALLDVPDLDLSGSKTGGDVSTVRRPLDAGDVGGCIALEQRADGARLSRPDVDVALETNGDLVARRPVKKVEVVVVNKAWSVKNTLWGSWDTTTELGSGSDRLERTVVLGAEVDWAGRFWWRWLESEDTLAKVDVAGRSNRGLVGGGLWRWLGVSLLVLVVIVNVQAVKGESLLVRAAAKVEGTAGSRGKDRRTLARLRTALVLLDLGDTSVANGLASVAVWDETVGSGVVDANFSTLDRPAAPWAGWGSLR